jgi:hypothetical protein
MFSFHGLPLVFSLTSDLIDNYFIVECPACYKQEMSNQIKMLGIFGITTAKWGPGCVILLVGLCVLIWDYF